MGKPDKPEMTHILRGLNPVYEPGMGKQKEDQTLEVEYLVLIPFTNRAWANFWALASSVCGPS